MNENETATVSAALSVGAPCRLHRGGRERWLGNEFERFVILPHHHPGSHAADTGWQCVFTYIRCVSQPR